MDLEEYSKNRPYLSFEEREILSYYRLAKFLNKEKTKELLKSMNIDLDEFEEDEESEE